MKKERLALIIITNFFALITFGQISATTSAGAKVILNQDGTWKYAANGEEEKPCSKNHTGSLAVTNTTDGDLYFYYSIGEYNKLQFLKVKAHSTRSVDDIVCGQVNWNGKLDGTWNWEWKAAPELQEKASSLSYIKGAIETGTFNITECTVKQVKIGG